MLRAHAQIGRVRFDRSTERSTLVSLNAARRDVEGILWTCHVLGADPVWVSERLCRRPASIRGDWVWPNRLLRELVAGLPPTADENVL